MASGGFRAGSRVRKEPGVGTTVKALPPTQLILLVRVPPELPQPQNRAAAGEEHAKDKSECATFLANCFLAETPILESTPYRMKP